MCDFHMHVSLLAASLKRSHIRLVAIDFDDTLLSLHTHSKWELGPTALANNVRPFFMEFIPAALRKGIIVSIVTFSSQRRLIQQTLREAFGQTVARQILVRGYDGSWTPSPAQCTPKSWHSCSRRGKTDHILHVVTKIYNDSDVEVKPEQVLLIDDTEMNVLQARYDGMCAIQFDVQDPSSGDASESSILFKRLMATFRGKSAKSYQMSSSWPPDDMMPLPKHKVHNYQLFETPKGIANTSKWTKMGDDVVSSVDDTVSLNSNDFEWDCDELMITDGSSRSSKAKACDASSSSSSSSSPSSRSSSSTPKSRWSSSRKTTSSLGDATLLTKDNLKKDPDAEVTQNHPLARNGANHHARCVPADSCSIM